MCTRRCTKNYLSQSPKFAITERRSYKNPQATSEERHQREIELDSLERENEGMENNSRTEKTMKICKVFKTYY